MPDKKEKKILLTFDYELSLGIDTGTVSKCILEPTELILDLFKKYNGKGLFFIDAAYLLTLKKNKNRDLFKIQKQLNKILKYGNDIGLHIHPQWLDAELLDSERWTFKSFEKYKLHSLTKSEAGRLFKDSLNIIYELLDDKKYKITSFRAGGWCVQPFSFIKDFFIKHNIIYDFSITPGIKLDSSEFSNYDYSNAPKNISSWKFIDNPCMINQEGKFVEVPLTTVKVRQLDLWLNYYLYKKNEKESGDGRAISIKDSKKTKDKSGSKLDKVFKIFRPVYASLNIDGLSFGYFKKILKKGLNYNTDFVTAVCHPKKISKNSMKNLEYLLKKIQTIGISDLS